MTAANLLSCGQPILVGAMLLPVVNFRNHNAHWFTLSADCLIC